MKIGARTLKTGIAIFFALLIPHLLNIPEGSGLAGISAIYSLQPSIRKSFDTLKSRILANTIGGVVAVVMTYFFGSSFFIIGVSSAFLIAILHQLKLDDVLGLAVVTMIIIMLTDQETLVYNALIRVLATIIGVSVAFVLNRFFMPPNYNDQMIRLIDVLTNEITKNLRACLRKNAQFAILRDDIKWFWKKINKLDLYLSLMRDEAIFSFNPFKKKADVISKGRRLVVYRQFIRTTTSAVYLVETFHHTENVYNHFPEDLRILIRERLETLMSAHEQILLKFTGRVQPDEVNFIAYKAPLRKTFMDSFFTEASLESYMKGEYGESNSVIRIMAAILKYEEDLQRLNKLVRSYKQFHLAGSADNINELSDID